MHLMSNRPFRFDTMANECDVSKIVTTFLLNTCRLPPPPNQCYVEAATHCSHITNTLSVDDNEGEGIPLITGR